MADLVGTMIQLGLLIVFLLVLAFLVGYIYAALALCATARRLGIKDAWLAWIPIGNLYLLSQMAKMDWRPVLLVVGVPVPIFGVGFAAVLVGFTILWTVKVCEAKTLLGIAYPSACNWTDMAPVYVGKISMGE